MGTDLATAVARSGSGVWRRRSWFEWQSSTWSRWVRRGEENRAASDSTHAKENPLLKLELCPEWNTSIIRRDGRSLEQFRNERKDSTWKKNRIKEIEKTAKNQNVKIGLPTENALPKWNASIKSGIDSATRRKSGFAFECRQQPISEVSDFGRRDDGWAGSRAVGRLVGWRRDTPPRC